jgi:putative glycosyl transferase, group 1 family
VREAMACSVPCIVTNIPGARDLIIDGVTGLLVPPSSPQKMAASIRSLIDNPERLEAFAKASREHIIQDFSVKAYTDGFATLFRSIKKA